jgi:hypothetical protein
MPELKVMSHHRWRNPELACVAVPAPLEMRVRGRRGSDTELIVARVSYPAHYIYTAFNLAQVSMKVSYHFASSLSNSI